jgi:hypothetical protein
MKKLLIALFAIAAVATTGEGALAQGHGGPSAGVHGSGSWHGGSAWHGGGSWRGGYWGPRVGIYVGGPAYWGAWGYPWYGGYPYAYPYAYAPYPAAYVAQDAPSYSEPPLTQGEYQGQPQGQANFWYYCTDPAGYYPYVQGCSKAWVQVTPQAVPPPSAPAPQ